MFFFEVGFLCGPGYLNSLLSQPGLELRDPPAFASPHLSARINGTLYLLPAMGIQVFKPPYRGVREDAGRGAGNAGRSWSGGCTGTWWVDFHVPGLEPWRLWVLRLNYLLYFLVPGLGDAWGQPSRTGPLDSVAKELGSHLLQVEPRDKCLAVADVSRVSHGASRPQKWGARGLGTGAQGSGVHLD